MIKGRRVLEALVVARILLGLKNIFQMGTTSSSNSRSVDTHSAPSLGTTSPWARSSPLIYKNVTLYNFPYPLDCPLLLDPSYKDVLHQGRYSRDSLQIVLNE